MATVRFFCALVLLALIGQASARFYTTNGESGDLCGGRNCVLGLSTCQDGSCKCKKRYTKGKGLIDCYKKSEVYTEVTNDPQVETLNSNKYELPIPCRYMLTHIISEFKNKKRKVIGVCELVVYTIQAKHLGKFYVRGMDAALRVEMNNGSRVELSVRIISWARDGLYSYNVSATKGEFLHNGPYNDDNITVIDEATGLKILLELDQKNNMLLFHAKKCGVHTRIRGYDLVRRKNQTQTPGMSVAASCAFGPEFDYVDKVMALTPIINNKGFTVNSIKIPGLSIMESMLYRAFVSGVEQNQPGGNDECRKATDIVRGCRLYDELQMAFKSCVWILRSPRFIKCVDISSTGLEIMRLFNSCVSIYCGGASCNYVIGMVNSTNCQETHDYPMLSMFVSGAMCP